MKNHHFSLILGITFLCLTCQRVPEPAAANHPLLEHLREEVNRGNVLICAHRGFHNDTVPENSLAAIQLAVKSGIDIVELDVRTTADDSLMLMHDHTVDRTTNGSGPFADLTYTQVKQLRLTLGDSITNHQVPTLREALLTLDTPTYANLDIKALDFDALLHQLRQLNMELRVLSYIGHPDDVISLTEKSPQYAVLPKADTMPEIPFFAQAISSPLIHFDKNTYTEEGMTIARQNDQLVFMNILWAEDTSLVEGNTEPLDQFFTLKPAIVQTDYPDLLLNYLRKNGLHK